MSVVHDASSLLAVAFREPGAEVARAKLRGSVISAVNWSEVVLAVMERGGRVEGLAQVFGGLGVSVMPFDVKVAARAAALYPVTRDSGLSFEDRACLALGLELNREIVTADRRWAGLELEVKIVVIRSEGR